MELISSISDILWTYVLLGALLGCGVWFTIRTRFVQFRMLGEMVRLLTESAESHKTAEAEGAESHKTAEAEGAGSTQTANVGSADVSPKQPRQKHISSFQAFAVSLATRVGTGNLAGVATAIAIGGPGSIIWMWLIALLGAATSFVESTLAQLYKQRHTDSFVGGPAYYISKGLHKPWMAVLFAVLITLTFALSNNSVQGNTICGAMEKAFGLDPAMMGWLLAILTLTVVFGGIQRVAHVSSVVVPIMAVGYLVLVLVVIVLNIDKVPHVLRVIIDGAFGVQQFAGGALGTTIIMGVKRGLFSNEAGEGSAPNAAATASTSHPVKQGLIQALGVFTDTLIVCSCTAFIILISGLYEIEGLNGIDLTQSALQAEVGSVGPIFIAIAIFLFAYSSIIGNYYYGETNVRYLSRGIRSARVRWWLMTVFRILSGGVMVVFGALASLDTVWTIVDVFMALLTAVNLIAIVTLGRYAFRLLDNYLEQRRRGVKSPVFHRSMLPEVEQDIECWE